MFRKIFLASALILSLNFFPLGDNNAEAADVYTVISASVYQDTGDAALADWIARAICYASSEYNVDPLLLTAVMQTESDYYYGAVSRAGAVGFMQLMPDTAASIGVNPYDPLSNILGGAQHLSTLLKSFSGYGQYSVTNAIAAYNAGAQAVIDYGGCPPYNETVNYVITVSDNYQALLSQYYA